MYDYNIMYPVNINTIGKHRHIMLKCIKCTWEKAREHVCTILSLIHTHIIHIYIIVATYTDFSYVSKKIEDTYLSKNKSANPIFRYISQGDINSMINHDKPIEPIQTLHGVTGGNR